MLSFLQKLFGFDQRRYERQKQALKGGDPAKIREMAGSEGTHPEVLYFLAHDGDPDIRRAIALNRATPLAASALLANDQSVDVRLALAARLLELLPGLSTDKHRKLYAYAVQALGVLAQDEVLKIRQVLSSALKDYAKAPPKVVGQLARDLEREVSEPILRFCVALSDDDLLDILGHHPEPWVVETIAARPAVSDEVASAVVGTKDVAAGTALINNPGAQFSSETLRKIIDNAEEVPEWHEPLAGRKELTLDLAHRLSGFVSAAVLSVLERRSDFDAATKREIAGIVKRRLEFQRQGAPNETAESRVERYVKAGKLGPDVILDALAWRDTRFVLLAISYLSRIHPIVAEKMLRSGTPKSMLALCWMARLPMRVAVELQRSYARLDPREIMYARGGTEYPMTLPEIKWQLEFYGVNFEK